MPGNQSDYKGDSGLPGNGLNMGYGSAGNTPAGDLSGGHEHGQNAAPRYSSPWLRDGLNSRLIGGLIARDDVDPDTAERTADYELVVGSAVLQQLIDDATARPRAPLTIDRTCEVK